MELKTKYSILKSQIDINNTLTPHAGLILSRILNIHVTKYASVLSIQAHDEPNSNIIRTPMFRITLFTKSHHTTKTCRDKTLTNITCEPDMIDDNILIVIINMSCNLLVIVIKNC